MLLSGATGFVGRHIYPALVAAGHDVVCGTRDPALAKRQDPRRTYCELELDDPVSVNRALAQVDRAIYLVHSMTDHAKYGAAEAKGAATFRSAAEARGLERIVYLVGMRPSGKVSQHLQSRLDTGEALRAGSVPVVELQATMIIGGGSESFRMVRDIATRLPWMLFPSWLRSESEPIGIADIAAAVVYALSMPLPASRVLAVPGPERLSGREIIMRTARLVGHKPRVANVPFVSPKLSSYWIRLVTRANPQVATELVEGMRSDILASGPQIWDDMPGHVRMSFDGAVRAALAEEQDTLRPAARWFERLTHRLARETP
ncbi:hypothetical protein BH11MYX1_BH11MYX1_25030 [soil metagenome]